MGFFKQKVLDWLGYEVSTAAFVDSDSALASALENVAVKETALYTSIGLMADLIGGCDIQVLEGGKPVKNGNWYTLNVSPNPNQTANQLISRFVSKLYYKGEALMVPLGKHLYVADSYGMDEYPVKGNVFSSITIGNYQVSRKFKAGDVYYVQQNNPQIRRLVNDIFTIYEDLLSYSKKAYAQGSGEKYAIQTGKTASGSADEQKKAMEDIKERMQAFVDATSAALPLTREQTIQRLSSATSASSSSVDYPTLRKDIYAIVAEMLHFPAGLLDGTLTSVDQVFNQALTTAIDPLADLISQELTRKTYTEDQITHDGCKIRVDTSCIKHIDIVDCADKLEKLIESGMSCVDDNLRLIGWPEIGEDWSRKHFITKNFTDIKNLDSLEGGE